MHFSRAERPVATVIAVLIVGLLADMCVFTPYQPIAFGKRSTSLSAAMASGVQAPAKRDSKSGASGLIDAAVSVWSLEPIVAGTTCRPAAPDACRHQVQRTPLGSRPPPFHM